MLSRRVVSWPVFLLAVVVGSGVTPAQATTKTVAYQCVSKTSVGRIFYARDAKQAKSLAKVYCSQGQTAKRLPAANNPPVAEDLLKLAVPLPGHEGVQFGQPTIVGGPAYRGFGNAEIERIDLASGQQRWQATFPSAGLTGGQATPAVGVTDDRRLVYGLRPATRLNGAGAADDVAGWQLIAASVSTGKLKWSRFISDPKAVLGSAELPPSIIGANSTTVVTSQNPEVGFGTAAIKLPKATIAWHAGQQAAVAGKKVVLVRAVAAGKVVVRALSRTTGKTSWQLRSRSASYLYLGKTSDAFLVDKVANGHTILWVAKTSGKILAATSRFQTKEAELECQQTQSVLACTQGSAADRLVGFDLNTGRRLWSAAAPGREIPTLTSTYRDWLYGVGSGAEPNGLVIDARTGLELRRNVNVPSIQYSNSAGILVTTPEGRGWAVWRG